MIKAILFDMDGTLVPMNMEEFTNGYFKFLVKKLETFGIPADKLIASVWAGTKAMVKNDGSVRNREAFWKKFEEETGVGGEEIDKACLDFYGNEFQAAKMFTKDNPLAKKAIEISHKKADIVCLATNPLFPMVGQITRMSWVGLKPSDFDLVTSYESDSYCKPNPEYFFSVVKRLGVEPHECLLIGNDEYEDMYAGTVAGLNCYLVTDTMIPSKEHPWSGDRGSFEDLIAFLENLD